MSATTYQFHRFEVRRGTLLWAALLLNTELLLLVVYYAFSPGNPSSLAVFDPASWLSFVTPALPMVWINVGLWALVRTDPPSASQRRKTAALAIATAYFGVLAYFGGLWGMPDPHLPLGVDVSLFTAPPGWAPRVFVNTPVFRVHLLPYKAVGYLALGYLVYATVLEAAGSAVSGVVGLLSCISCTWPVLAAVVSGLAGAGTAVAEAAVGPDVVSETASVGVQIPGSLYYPLSTVVFVVTVGLLVWRPGWRS